MHSLMDLHEHNGRLESCTQPQAANASLLNPLNPVALKLDKSVPFAALYVCHVC